MALLVAPVLALLAWFAVHNLIGEQAQPAQAGQAYPLLPDSNCRYASGRCDLRNGDITLSLQLRGAPAPAMELMASHALDAVVLSIAAPNVQPAPEAMQRLAGDGTRWRLPLASAPAVDLQIRLVATVRESRYFAETGSAFLGQPAIR